MPAPRATAEPSVVDPDVLPAQDQHRRPVVAHDVRPGLDGLVAVGRSDHVEPRHRSQRGQVLDRLVRRAVLTDTDGVVREHEAALRARERGEADRAVACSRRTRRTCRRSAACRRGGPCRRAPSPWRARGCRSAGTGRTGSWRRERGRARQSGAVAAGEVGGPGDQAGQPVVAWRRAPSGSPCGWRATRRARTRQVGVPTVGAGGGPGRLPLGRRGDRRCSTASHAARRLRATLARRAPGRRRRVRRAPRTARRGCP